MDESITGPRAVEVIKLFIKVVPGWLLDDAAGCWAVAHGRAPSTARLDVAVGCCAAVTAWEADEVLRCELNMALRAYRLAGDRRTTKQLLTVLLGPNHRDRYKIELWPGDYHPTNDFQVLGLWRAVL